MIQFNLLPDVKLAYLKSKRLKRIVILSSMALSAAVIILVALLALFVFGAQKLHLRNLNSDVEELTQQIEDIPDINRILTVQNQLNSLTALHEANPESSRIVSFIQQVTPEQATVEELDVNFEESTITITGEAQEFNIVNRYADTLKFTVYTIGDADPDETGENAFPPNSVVLSDFGRTEEGYSFTIESAFNPAIFDNTLDITLHVPNIITTRSITERPELLFRETSPDLEEEEEE